MSLILLYFYMKNIFFGFFLVYSIFFRIVKYLGKMHCMKKEEINSELLILFFSRFVCSFVDSQAKKNEESSIRLFIQEYYRYCTSYSQSYFVFLFSLFSFLELLITVK